ncbi:GPN-loop GTPase 2-like protein [Dinothrombium tinctorium]|uniref:GPN-loop GTPase 2 n=1 Tax=Dinothrombium tinctorium TaxID=1965070 RepID=A0A443RE48_9ACAR|nr:GPN-loop GTPase 2-like protein [Dinothrombium tinctorium]
MEKKRKVIFGQLVIGPPSSGKSTYCRAVSEHLKQRSRNAFVINLDPGNDVSLPYSPAIDVTSLITVEDSMNALHLGPNGALLYCMEYLESNCEWLFSELQKLCEKEVDPYLIFDSPGQVELYVHHNSMKNLVNALCNKQRPFDLRLCVVNLTDSHCCNEPGKYISALLTSLSSMVHFELPHINILSKIDLIQKYGKVGFGLDFYCEVLDLNYLLDRIEDDPFFEKYKELSKSIAGVVQDYSLVSFVPLNINDAKTIIAAMRLIDKANGFYLTNIETEEQLQRFFLDCGESDFDYSKYYNIRETML